jgi:hypothetical protein
LYDGYGKLDESSPTVATDSIFTAGVVDAKDGREMAILDTVNTFLHT